MGTLRCKCATVPQPSELLRFGVVPAVSRGIAVLDGAHAVQGEGRFWGFCSLFSQWEMPLGRRRWNVSDSYVKTSQHFRSANISLESSIRGLFGDIFSFKIKVGVYEKLAKKVTIALRKLTLLHLQRRLFLELDCAWPWPWLCVLA